MSVRVLPASVSDQVGDVALELGCFGVDEEDALEPAAGQVSADAVVVGDHLEDLADPGAGGQAAHVVLVAGGQAAQLGVGSVGKRGAFEQQVVAVVQQGTQVRGWSHGEPHRRQCGVAGGDPGDRQGVNRVCLALPDLGSAFARGHQGGDLGHRPVAGPVGAISNRIGVVGEQGEVDRDRPAEAAGAFDADPEDPQTLEHRGQVGEPVLGVAHLLAGYLPSLLVHDGDRQRVFVRVDACVQPAHLT